MTSMWQTLGWCLLIFTLLRCCLWITQDPTEPPVVARDIPFFSPIYWMIKKKTRFHVWLRDNYHLPIYTLRLPGVRMYVVNSTSLITAVQRQPKILAFAPLKVKAAISLAASSKTANDILRSEAYGEFRSGEYANLLHKALQRELSPGSLEFREMVLSATENITSILQEVGNRCGHTFGMYRWIKKEMVLTTTNALYGPRNPFKHPHVRESYWEFCSGMMYILFGLSSLTRRSNKARETIVESFRSYYRSDSHLMGSGVTRTRYKYNVKNGMPLEDIARFEIGWLVAVLTNIVPTSFWMVYHVYSNPTLLEACRDEVRAKTSETTDSEGRTVRTICMSGLETSYPTIMAVLKEVLRIRTVGTSVRLVMEDHMLSGKYLLKKDSLVMIPSKVQHSDMSIWGPNAREFDHERFLNPSRQFPSAAFRAFGGGASFCPGRHFATTIIVGFTAMLIMRYDIEPAGGTWPCPTTDQAGAWEATPQPDEDIDVQISFWGHEEKRQRAAERVTFFGSEEE